jgi:four helix bundle protein
MARYVQMAMGSGAELSHHFLLAKDLGLMKSADYENLSADVNEIMRMLSALLGKQGVPTQHSRFELRAKG